MKTHTVSSFPIMLFQKQLNSMKIQLLGKISLMIIMSPRNWNNRSCCSPETDSSSLCFFLNVMSSCTCTHIYTLLGFIRKVLQCWYNAEMEHYMDPGHWLQIRTNERFSSTKLMPHSNSYSVHTLLRNVVCGVVKNNNNKKHLDVWTSQGLISNNNSHWHNIKEKAHRELSMVLIRDVQYPISWYYPTPNSW